MRISDWSSDVCSSDLAEQHRDRHVAVEEIGKSVAVAVRVAQRLLQRERHAQWRCECKLIQQWIARDRMQRSEEHTSELQSLMRISYAVFCLKKQLTQRNLYIYSNHVHYTTKETTT